MEIIPFASIVMQYIYYINVHKHIHVLVIFGFQRVWHYRVSLLLRLNRMF